MRVLEPYERVKEINLTIVDGKASAEVTVEDARLVFTDLECVDGSIIQHSESRTGERTFTLTDPELIKLYMNV